MATPAHIPTANSLVMDKVQSAILSIYIPVIVEHINTRIGQPLFTVEEISNVLGLHIKNPELLVGATKAAGGAAKKPAADGAKKGGRRKATGPPCIYIKTTGEPCEGVCVQADLQAMGEDYHYCNGCVKKVSVKNKLAAAGGAHKAPPAVRGGSQPGQVQSQWNPLASTASAPATSVAPFASVAPTATQQIEGHPVPYPKNGAQLLKVLLGGINVIYGMQPVPGAPGGVINVALGVIDPASQQERPFNEQEALAIRAHGFQFTPDSLNEAARQKLMQSASQGQPAPAPAQVATPAPLAQVGAPAPLAQVGAPAPLAQVGAPAPLAQVGAPAPLAQVGALAPLAQVGAPAPLAQVGAPAPLAQVGAPAPLAQVGAPAPLAQVGAPAPLAQVATPNDQVASHVAQTPTSGQPLATDQFSAPGNPSSSPIPSPAPSPQVGAPAFSSAPVSSNPSFAPTPPEGVAVPTSEMPSPIAV